MLQQFPQVEIEGLTWSVGKPATPMQTGAGAPGSTARPDPAGDAAVLLELTGRVNATQRDDYRGITAQVQRFAAALRRLFRLRSGRHQASFRHHLGRHAHRRYRRLGYRGAALHDHAFAQAAVSAANRKDMR